MILDANSLRICAKCNDIQYVEKAEIPSSDIKLEKNGNSNYLRDSERLFKLITDEYLKDISKLRGGEK